ncbi:MAG: ABC transporter [Theionarchaea archaeon DG-70-1]|nr:MAG: ABC transporter [Theionarchaea archaeon DG-70-1]
MEEIVTLENVSAHLDHIPVLEDITLSIQQNDFLSVIGPNGGGKTTLLKIILGLVKPTKGEVTVFGNPPESGRRSIGYLPQGVGFDMQFPITVFDAVIMGRYQRFKKYSDTDRKCVSKTLKIVGMSDFADRQIGHLSGGELQRVLLARALVREPMLLLLDEPTASVDPEMQKSFYDLLSRLKEKMAIVLVTHDLSVISVYVESVACLNRKLFYHGPAEGAMEALEDVYQCPIEVIAHGIPHRVLRRHNNDRDTPV